MDNHLAGPACNVGQGELTCRLNLFQARYRRMLVDMHIGDWDEKFLKPIRPREDGGYVCEGPPDVGDVLLPVARGACALDDAESARCTCAFTGADIVGEMLAELAKRSIAACGYYSVVLTTGRTWSTRVAQQPAGQRGLGGRYGPGLPQQ